jgi:hypothetical protein
VVHGPGLVQDDEVCEAAAQILHLLGVDALEADKRPVLELDLLALEVDGGAQVGRAVLEDIGQLVLDDFLGVLRVRRQVQDARVGPPDGRLEGSDDAEVGLAGAAGPERKERPDGRCAGSPARFKPVVDVKLITVELVPEKTRGPTPQLEVSLRGYG